MAKLKIVKVGDQTLRTVCKPIDTITPRIVTLLNDMLDTMRNADGVGLAAPQVGVLRRAVVVECEPGTVYQMINPEIIESSGEHEDTEGCLSIPGEFGITHRPMEVTVRYTDIHGKEQTVKGEGLLARAFCHEIDHLNGILFTDHVIRMLDD